MRKLVAALSIAASVVGSGCGSSKPAPMIVPSVAAQGGHPAGVRFASQVDNPWYPLKPGTTLVYRGIKDARPSRDVFKVTHRKQVIDGVPCTVVTDLLYLSGKLEERTTDWYAQDTAGNVWYFGEETAELDRSGRVKSVAGTWKAGVKGAVAGIFFPAHPRPGQAGRQEFFKGQAEDHYRVKAIAASVKTPGGSSADAVLTEETTPLEPGVLDHKFYVRGIGTVLEQTVKGGDERNTLVSVRRG